LGIYYVVRMYTTFCFSRLAFYLQCYRVTSRLLEAEHRAIARIFIGPGNRCNRDDLRALGPILGASFSVSDVQVVNDASNQRLILHEPFLRTDGRREINSATSSSLEHFIWHRWQQWYTLGIINSIFQAQDDIVGRGISKAEILSRTRERPGGSSSLHVQQVVVHLLDGTLPPVQRRFIARLKR
jgi:hypothetical protein